VCFSIADAKVGVISVPATLLAVIFKLFFLAEITLLALRVLRVY
jgi:hypothetical protein